MALYLIYLQIRGFVVLERNAYQPKEYKCHFHLCAPTRSLHSSPSFSSSFFLLRCCTPPEVEFQNLPPPSWKPASLLNMCLAAEAPLSVSVVTNGIPCFYLGESTARDLE
ncbi:hypothetical protein AVEN_225890-1 [Araneus ventricosus]|uniref:Uncharacterized protein n=1 Tax=Araneus ventricosus TaxID=182803 RepID=A0A4Y2BE24_ARAVE|nr:hypothetical protein AVEN_225890-1 [Araneus ventricosus]